MNNNMLIIQGLTKRYGSTYAIKDISFQVKSGEIFGIIGTNGAGKTTTLECIEGLRKTDSGNIKVNGRSGVQLQSSSLPGSIKAIEAFNLFSKWNSNIIDLKLFSTFGLDDIKNKLYKDMSTGQKRRLHLALAMIGNPDILFLDEPTAGLDVEARVTLHNEIRKLKLQGKTIILSSHDMAEIESLCDKIIILKNGILVYNGSPTELIKHKGAESKIIIETSSDISIDGLKTCTYECKRHHYHVFTSTSVEKALLEIMTLVNKQEIKILDIRLEKSTLEEKFMDIAKGKTL